MRLALMIEGQEDVSWADWRALAQGCERYGIDTLFRSDHYLSVWGYEQRGALDAWTTLGALGAVTTSLRLGTLVSPATFRHPSVLAKSVVTADHVSGGRVELGIGSGWMDREHRAYGFPFPPLGERLERLAEQLEIVHRQWTEGPFDFAGAHYSVEGLDAQPKPIQRPHPPLIVGGHGGRRSLALAGLWADEYNTYNKAVAEVAAVRDGLDEACRAAGRDPIPLSLMTGWLVAEDRGQLVDRAGRLARWRGEEAAAEAFLASLPDSWIVGTPDEAREQLDRLRAAGVERVMAQHLLHRDLDALELIGRLSD